MKLIEDKRYFDKDICSRYELDNINHRGLRKHLTACYLLATHPKMKIQALAMRPESENGMRAAWRDCWDDKTFGDNFKSLEDFVRKYDDDCGDWHLKMRYDGYPISFGAYGSNAEIGCTCDRKHHPDVDALMLWIEHESNNQISETV